MKEPNLKTKAESFRNSFTIVEILVVVVLIVLIGSVGGGICVGTYKKMLAKKAARDFLLAAKYARIMAIERETPCRIELDTDGNKFVMVVDELNEETGQTEDMMVRDLYFKPVEFSGDITFEDIRTMPIGLEESFEDDEVQAIVFSPNGTSRSMIVQIGDGKNHYSISISASTGKAKMHVGTAEEVEINTIDLDEEL